MSQTHLAGGALFTAAGLGAATAAGWMHPPAWALALGIAWGAASHLVLDALTGPIPWAWPFAPRRLALMPAALRIRTGSGIATWLLRPTITIAAGIAILKLAALPSPPH